MKIRLITTLIAIFLFIGCGSSDSSSKEALNSWYKPKIDTSWQWQLQGDIDTSIDAKVYDIDLFESSKELIASLKSSGKRVICYFSAGSYENWRSDRDKFPQEAIGKSLDGWEGERWLDISNQQIRAIMQSRLDLAKQKGCDGVEPDNVDGYINNTGFNLTANEQLKYNIFLATQAHSRGLSIGLKNDLNQIKQLEAYFDFSINEQCHQFNECNKLLPFIKANKPVFNAEYEQKYVENINGERDKMCANSKELKIKTLILPLELDGSFRYSCD